MTQLELRLINPKEVNVDGVMDSKGIVFLGKATQQFDGTWRCLANVAGALCLVEVRISLCGQVL
jgi:hypothetical protein